MAVKTRSFICIYVKLSVHRNEQCAAREKGKELPERKAREARIKQFRGK